MEEYPCAPSVAIGKRTSIWAYFFISASNTQRRGVRNQYIKRFQNGKALVISVGNTYSEDQLMHTFLDNLEQSGK